MWWGSEIRSHSSSWDAGSVRFRSEVAMVSDVVLDQRLDGIWIEALAAVQEGQLDQERAAHDPGPQLDDQVTQCPGGAAGGQQIVVDQHPRPAGQRVGVDLQRVDPVFERVL